MALTVLALSNANLLQLLAGMTGDGQSIGVIAQRVERDRSNVRKTLQALAAEGLVRLASEGGDGTYASLTPAGHEALAAIERANNPAAILQANEEARDGDMEVPPRMIFPDPDQPRKDFDDAEIDQLAEAIAVSQWVQPILVRPFQPIRWAPGETGYPLTAGERRWRAVSRLIERKDPRWPEGRGIPIQVRDTDDRQTAVIALMENMHRSALKPLEEARGFERLRTVHKMETDAIAGDVGMSRRFVQQRLQLLKLDPEAQAELDAGRITVEQARKMVQDRPPPVQLSPAQLMMLAEIAAHVVPKGQPVAWKPAIVDYKAAEDDLFEEVRKAGCAQFACDFASKLWSVSLTDVGVRALVETVPDFLTDRDAALTRLRTNGAGPNAAAIAVEGWFLTPWLNSPHDMSPADRQRLDDQRREQLQAEAAKEAREQQTLTERQGGRDQLAAVLRLEQRANGLAVPDFVRRYAETWAAIGVPPRFGVRVFDGVPGADPVLEDGAGHPVTGYAEALEARRRMFAMGLNFASGNPPLSTAPPSDADIAALAPAVEAAADARAPLADVEQLMATSGLAEHVVRKTLEEAGLDDAGPVLTGDAFSRQIREAAKAEDMPQ